MLTAAPDAMPYAGDQLGLVNRQATHSKPLINALRFNAEATHVAASNICPMLGARRAKNQTSHVHK